jgi:alpha-tubulin suppressor-like RCC1 family protein
VGLRSDGTVAAVGLSVNGQCNVGGWTDIIQIAAGECHTVGLKSDGTVVAAGGYVPCFLPTPCFIWPLISGIIGAVVVVGLVNFFVRRRRPA